MNQVDFSADHFYVATATLPSTGTSSYSGGSKREGAGYGGLAFFFLSFFSCFSCFQFLKCYGCA